MSKKQKPAHNPNKKNPAHLQDDAKKNDPPQKKKAQYRVQNWSEYNRSLTRRGDITLWIDEEALAAWTPSPQAAKKRGGQQQYSDTAIECLLLVREVYHLPYRQTEGFARSLSKLLRIDLPVPNYTTLNRRAKTVTVKLKTNTQGAIHLVVDSSGLKVYGEGEWKARQHGFSKRRTWRKIHLAINEATGEVEAELLTDAGTDDAQAVAELLDAVAPPVEQFSGDGAYDKAKVYEALQKKGVGKVTIPPRQDAVFWPEADGQPHPRNDNLRQIQETSRAEWKKANGYHRRSLAETAVYRFKTIFGDKLKAREEQRQKTEARIKCVALNRMTRLGMPDSYCVA